MFKFLLMVMRKFWVLESQINLVLSHFTEAALLDDVSYKRFNFKDFTDKGQVNCCEFPWIGYVD